MRTTPAAILASLAVALVTTWKVSANPPLTRQARSCLGWHEQIYRALAWSEELTIHSPALRDSVLAEADKLRPRCIRDISSASLNRYVMLAKLLYDDEADETEGFD